MATAAKTPRYSGFTKDAIHLTTDFSRFGSPSKGLNNEVVPGQWTFMAVVDKQPINFKAPYPTLREFNGLKLMYREETIDGQQAQWFQLMDAVATAAEITVKAEAKTALSGMDW